MARDALKPLCYDLSQIDVDFTNPKAVSPLVWIGTVVRHDIAFAVGVLSRFIAVSQDSQLTAVKRVIQYLLRTKDTGLRNRNVSTSAPIAYSDSNWAGDFWD
jgi:hypothetical protein